MMKKEVQYACVIFVTFALAAAACVGYDLGLSERTPTQGVSWRVDACARERLYRECLQQVTSATQFNNSPLNEAVLACASTSQDIATLRGHQIKPECRN